MNKNEIGTILATGKKISVKEKEIIFTQNDVGKEMYILLKGKVGVYINSFDEFPIRVAEIEAGGIVGEMSLLDGSRRSATVVAEDDTLLLCVKKDDLPQLIIERPDLVMNLFRILSMRIRTLNERVSSLEGKLRDHPERNKKENTPGGQLTAQKDYKMTEPLEYKKYVRSSFLTCPVCQTDFLCEIPYFTLIQTRAITKEFRKLCVDFDPVWYDVVVCPCCYYANFYTRFGNLHKDNTKHLIESGYRQKVKPFRGYSEVRSVNEVLDALYLAVFCHTCMEEALTQGKLWLRIYWLYTDLNETALIHASAEKAIAAFSVVCEENSYDLKRTDARQIMAVMAALHQVLGNEEPAVSCYKNVLQLSDSSNDPIHIQAIASLRELGFDEDEINKFVSNMQKWKKGVRI